jgi:hypothetical protein
MGRARRKSRKVHAAFADGLGGLICGGRTAVGVATTPDEVTCVLCRRYMEKHPDAFPGKGLP